MLVPLVILGLLSICGGWIGIERFSCLSRARRRPAPWHIFRQCRASNSSSASLPLLVALEGWLIADKYYRRKTDRPAQLAAAMPTGYKLLSNKYYVDEIYGAVIRQAAARLFEIRPRLGSRSAILGGSRVAARRHRPPSPA